MNSNLSISLRRPLATPSVLGLMLLAGACFTAVHAGDFVPYAGGARGAFAVTFLADAEPVVASDVALISSHSGRGHQTFTRMDLSGFPWLVVAESENIAANGDVIFVTSTLRAIEVTASEIIYEGDFVVTGGTGQFDWGVAVPGANFGRGIITGSASYGFTAVNQVVLVFANTFDGEIAKTLPKKPSGTL